MFTFVILFISSTVNPIVSLFVSEGDEDRINDASRRDGGLGKMEGEGMGRRKDGLKE